MSDAFHWNAWSCPTSQTPVLLSIICWRIASDDRWAAAAVMTNFRPSPSSDVWYGNFKSCHTFDLQEARCVDLQKALDYQRALATFTRIVNEAASIPGLQQNAVAQSLASPISSM